jgi:hypothetical protein
VNIVYPQQNLVTAKTCGCKDTGKRRVAYAFTEEFHSLCMDKKDVIQAEIEACEKLLKYASDDRDKVLIEKEIIELRMALDLLT